jgi:hypothetical protein
MTTYLRLFGHQLLEFFKLLEGFLKLFVGKQNFGPIKLANRILWIGPYSLIEYLHCLVRLFQRLKRYSYKVHDNGAIWVDFIGHLEVQVSQLVALLFIVNGSQTKPGIVVSRVEANRRTEARQTPLEFLCLDVLVAQEGEGVSALVVQLNSALEELDGCVVLSLLAEAVAKRQARLHAVAADLLHLVAQGRESNLQQQIIMFTLFIYGHSQN